MGLTRINKVARTGVQGNDVDTINPEIFESGKLHLHGHISAMTLLWSKLHKETLT